jgi:dienelactone hydrolase
MIDLAPAVRTDLDTLERRWALLEPRVTVVGPPDDLARPAVLLFHGCGGMRSHLNRYAAVAKAAGVRAFIVDSYGARGWSRPFALSMVCSGLMFRGDARAGDILAAIWGVSRRKDVDASRLTLAGWSHGGWGIMELMSSALTAPGEIGLADPQAGDLSGVRSAFLAYPYIGFVAKRRMAPWLRFPPTLAVIAAHDHLTTVRNATRVYEAVSASGVPVETWLADAAHSFDEPLDIPPMRHHPQRTLEALERFKVLLETTLLPVESATSAPKA